MLGLYLVFAAVAWIVGREISLATTSRAQLAIARHLRHGPLTLFLTIVVAVVGYHGGSYAVSRWQIHRYIYSTADPTIEPDFSLHLISPSFCGNANAGQIYALYGEAAAEGIDDADPAVRARTVQASRWVCDRQLCGSAGSFDRVLAKALVDLDPMVRRLADEVVADAER